MAIGCTVVNAGSGTLSTTTTLAGTVLAAPAILRAQTGPMRIGFLTVKTGPLASGGIQMEQGLTLYLKERNNMLAGRPVHVLDVNESPLPFPE